MGYFIAIVISFIVGHHLGKVFGYNIADENWTDTLERHGWRRVVEEDGDNKLEQMYGDHWYDHPGESD